MTFVIRRSSCQGPQDHSGDRYFSACLEKYCQDRWQGGIYSIDCIDHYQMFNSIERKGGALWRLTFSARGIFSRLSGGTMQGRSMETLRLELMELLQKQAELLNARAFGSATDGDVIDYELRQDVINDICQQLAKSSAA
jgi:hypothetical protein